MKTANITEGERAIIISSVMAIMIKIQENEIADKCSHFMNDGLSLMHKLNAIKPGVTLDSFKNAEFKDLYNYVNV